MNKEFLESFQAALNQAKPGYRAAMPKRSLRPGSIRNRPIETADHIASLRAASALSASDLDDDFEFFTGKARSEPLSGSEDAKPAAQIIPIEPDAPAKDGAKPFPEGAVYDPKTNKITGWKG